MSSFSDMLLDSYTAPEDSSSQESDVASMRCKGTASGQQLSYIEKLSGGIGDMLAEERFGKALVELNAWQASLLIDMLRRIASTER